MLNAVRSLPLSGGSPMLRRLMSNFLVAPSARLIPNINKAVEQAKAVKDSTVDFNTPLDELPTDAIMRRMNAISTQLNDNDIARPLYMTSNHKTIVTSLSLHVNALQNNEYKGRDSVCSATILGPKGIGKSTSLKTFCTLLPYVAPELKDVLPIYISYADASIHISLGYFMRKVVVETLLNRGVEGADRLDNSTTDRQFADYEAAVSLVKAHKLKLLVVADEMEMLYTHPNTSDTAKIAVTSLEVLTSMAASQSGLFVTYVCGSSSSLPALMTRKPLSGAQQANFCLQGGPNMNGSKFRERRLEPCVLNDEERLFAILGKNSKPAERAMVSFFAGTNPRLVDIFCDALRTFERAHKQHCPAKLKLVAQELISLVFFSQATSAKTWQQYEPALIEIYKAMANTMDNRRLLDSVKSASNPTPDAFATVDWSAWQPLPAVSVTDIIKKRFPNDDVLSHISFLEDRGWIAGDRSDHGISKFFLPTTFLNVWYAEKLYPKSSDLFSDLLKSVQDFGKSEIGKSVVSSSLSEFLRNFFSSTSL